MKERPNYTHQRILTQLLKDALRPLKKEWKPLSISDVIRRIYLEWHYYRSNYGEVPDAYRKLHNIKLSQAEQRKVQDAKRKKASNAER